MTSIWTHVTEDEIEKDEKHHKKQNNLFVNHFEYTENKEIFSMLMESTNKWTNNEIIVDLVRKILQLLRNEKMIIWRIKYEKEMVVFLLLIQCRTIPIMRTKKLMQQPAADTIVKDHVHGFGKRIKRFNNKKRSVVMSRAINLRWFRQ